MRSDAALRRYHHEVGAPLAVHYHRIGLVPVVIAIVIWVLITVSLLLSPSLGSAATGIVALVLALLLAAGMCYLSGGEVLAVCEGGVILGSVAPLRSRFVVRYDQMTPGSVVPVTRSRLFPRTLNIYSALVSIRNAGSATQGVYFVGPSPLQARRRALPLPLLVRPTPLTVGTSGSAAPPMNRS